MGCRSGMVVSRCTLSHAFILHLVHCIFRRKLILFVVKYNIVVKCDCKIRKEDDMLNKVLHKLKKLIIMIIKS